MSRKYKVQSNIDHFHIFYDSKENLWSVTFFGIRSLNSNFWTTKGRWRPRKLQNSASVSRLRAVVRQQGTGSHALSSLQGIDPKTRSYQSY